MPIASSPRQPLAGPRGAPRPRAASPAPRVRRDRRQLLGAWGERIAARWLRARGWTVVASRFRSGHRDLDLVVRRGTLVAFVEVKTRRDGRFGDPTEAVHWRKRRELVRSARVWIDRFGQPGDAYRFDVVGVLIGLDVPRRDGGRPERAVGRCGPVSGGAEGRPGDGESGVRVRVRHVPDAFQVPVGA